VQDFAGAASPGFFSPVDYLRNRAAEQGKRQLACRFSTALGQACGSKTTEE
jgi:hypothetical protein